MIDLAAASDGGILVCGSIPKPRRRYEAGEEFEAHRELVVVKLTPRGRLDRRFGHDGVATPSVPGESTARVILGERDGSILVAGLRTRTNPQEPEYGLYRPFLLRLDRDGSLLRRFEKTPIASFGSGYEAAKFASNMSDLLVAGGHVFVAAGDPDLGTGALLTYSVQGSGGSYLPLSRTGLETVVAIASRGRELVVLATRTSGPNKGPHGFILRAFHVR